MSGACAFFVNCSCGILCRQNIYKLTQKNRIKPLRVRKSGVTGYDTVKTEKPLLHFQFAPSLFCLSGHEKCDHCML